METFDLALILTAAGATVSAALIAAFVQILKRVPQFGAWLDANREPGFVLFVSLLLVAYAYIATTPDPLNPVKAFAAWLAWVGIAGLATKAYDVAPPSVKTALGGSS